MKLSADQLYNLDQTTEDIKMKSRILETAVDVQVILQLLVQKNIVTREEVENMRDIVRNSPKYKNTYIDIQQTIQELEKYKKCPGQVLKEMFNEKLSGNK